MPSKTYHPALCCSIALQLPPKLIQSSQPAAKPAHLRMSAKLRAPELNDFGNTRLNCGFLSRCAAGWHPPALGPRQAPLILTGRLVGAGSSLIPALPCTCGIAQPTDAAAGSHLNFEVAKFTCLERARHYNESPHPANWTFVDAHSRSRSISEVGELLEGFPGVCRQIVSTRRNQLHCSKSPLGHPMSGRPYWGKSKT